VIISFQNQKIQKHLTLEKGCWVYLLGGKHTGTSGMVKELSEEFITIKPASGEEFQTPRRFAIVIGKEKPEITLGKEG